MKTKIHNQTDLEAMAKVASLDADSTLTRIIAACAEAICPNEEDFTCSVTKMMLQPSYRYNASLFSRLVISHAPSFSDASGHLHDGVAEIILYRHQQQNKTTRPHSILNRVREALSQEPHEITIPVAELPPSWIRRPEQIIYKLRLELGTKPTIERHLTFWKISI